MQISRSPWFDSHPRRVCLGGRPARFLFRSRPFRPGIYHEEVPSALLPIFLIVVVDILGMTIMYPLLPFYAEHHGAGPLGAGLLISVYALCQLFGGPLLGRLSDRTGRKPLLLVSQVGTLFGFVLLAFADSLWLIFLSRSDRWIYGGKHLSGAGVHRGCH